MKRYQVTLTRRARRELAVARAWWRLYRPAAPGAIDRAMRAARTLLARFPDAGASPNDPDLERLGLQRLLLQGVDYHLYYRIFDEEHRIEIITIWHASRLPPRT